MSERLDGRAPRHDHSAGGLVVRGSEVLLISTQGATRWQLPKGHLEEGETPEEAAVREVREETGVTGCIVGRLPAIDYHYADRTRRVVHKHVDYFLLAFEEGDAANFDPKEVSGAAWMSWDEALARLTFDNERRVVLAARALADQLSSPKGDRS